MNEAGRFKKELLIQEYGSNVLKIVEHINEISDKTQRTEKCKLLIKLIEKMNPSVRYAENSEQILWGHLYVLSNMKLDVDVNFPIPNVEVTRPEKVKYPVDKPKYKHYGTNIDILTKKLAELKDEDDKSEAAISLGKLLKTLYSNWNNPSVGDKLIAHNIESLTKGNLSVDPELIKEDSKNSPFYTKRTGPNNYSRTNTSNNRSNNNRNRNNNPNQRKNNSKGSYSKSK